MSDPEFDRVLLDLRERCEYLLSHGLTPGQVVALGSELEAHRETVLHTYVNPAIWRKP